MFELTNEQRKCFALPPVLDSWRRIEVKAGPHDNYVTYAFLDGRKIMKVIQVSEKPGCELYTEYSVDQMLSEDGTKILPKTAKGKPQIFSAPTLVSKTHIDMSVIFSSGYIDIYNYNSAQSYYISTYNSDPPKNLNDFSKWAEDWCAATGDTELADIRAFSERQKTRQKYREGDFFRFKINRRLFGYGRILVDYESMRKKGVPFWDIFMGKPICAAVYHIATEQPDVTPDQLVHLKMLPSQMVMDNIFYYGECEIIGNLPIAADEDNYTIHYGKSIDARNTNFVYYQCGKTFAALENAETLHKGFRNNQIGVRLQVQLPILQKCIQDNSNTPYWEMLSTWKADGDLRNPAFQKELNEIKIQMGINIDSERDTFMNFTEIAEARQSCRRYDPDRPVEPEKIERILAAARLSPSACNGQPYLITVCKGEAAKKVSKATQGMGMNKFAADAPVMLVLSEMPYVKTAALGAKMKKNDYRSIDIGIAAAYITAEATAQGLGTCILGWLNDEKIREICGLDSPVRLVITLGYAAADDTLREKKRKEMDELVKTVE